MNGYDDDFKSQLKKASPYIRKIYTSLMASLGSVIFSAIIMNAFKASYEQNELDMQNYAGRAFIMILFPIVIIATAWLVFDYFDNVDLFNKRDYLKMRENEKRVKPLISEKPYLIGFAIEMAVAVFVFTKGYHMAITFFLPKASIMISELLAVATMAILRLWQLKSLQDKWEIEIESPIFADKAIFKRNRDPSKFKVIQLILQPLGYFIVFSLMAWFCGYFAFPMFMVIFVIIISPDMWWAIFSFPIVIIAIVYFTRAIHGIRKRRILIKKLKQMQAEGLATVETKGPKYLSSFITLFRLTVKVTDKEGNVYNCIVITGGKINAPMFFKEDEYLVEHGFHFRGGALLSAGGRFARAVDISTWGGKENPTNMVFGFRMSHKMRFPDVDGKHTVLLNPTSTTAFALSGTDTKPIDTGEDMKKYTIYTATGFFNHIERQSRKNKRDYDY